HQADEVGVQPFVVSEMQPRVPGRGAQGVGGGERDIPVVGGREIGESVEPEERRRDEDQGERSVSPEQNHRADYSVRGAKRLTRTGPAASLRFAFVFLYLDQSDSGGPGETCHHQRKSFW